MILSYDNDIIEYSSLQRIASVVRLGRMRVSLTRRIGDYGFLFCTLFCTIYCAIFVIIKIQWNKNSVLLLIPQ